MQQLERELPSKTEPESFNGFRIGIALSGGGCRAMAFHLGCLRTLHRLGLLADARVLSAVSGGAVIGAMYVQHQGSFEEFEQSVQSVLLRGFVQPALRVVVTTNEGLKAVLAFMLLCVASCWLLIMRPIARILGYACGGKARPSILHPWSPRRFASRTTVLRRTFDGVLFGNRTFGDLPKEKPDFVAVATELRSGSAFYFGSKGAGSWRFGRADAKAVKLAHAVAASAAYPLMLPALDEVVTFRKHGRPPSTERVTLTDGGVYDNLGLAPLWPDRKNEIGVEVERVDTIIACRAGYGNKIGGPTLFVGSTMKAAYNCTSNRLQNLSMKRLFDLRETGRLKAFALAHIDQVDERLEHAPSDLTPRTSVANYPTNFSAMAPEWIDRLSKRGEQLVLAVIRQHAPELMPENRTASAHGGDSSPSMKEEI